MKKIELISILLTVAMAATMTLIGFSPAIAQPSVVWVDNDYCDGCLNDGHTWGYDAFAKIQHGINAVASPGTVLVAAGKYFATYDENITLKPGVTLQGSGADITTIAATGRRNVYIVIGVNNSTIDGFIISGGWRGISCDSASPTVANCFFTNNYMAIVCSNSSSPKIAKNTFFNNGSKGVDIYSSSPIINNNGNYSAK